MQIGKYSNGRWAIHLTKLRLNLAAHIESKPQPMPKIIQLIWMWISVRHALPNQLFIAERKFAHWIRVTSLPARAWRREFPLHGCCAQGEGAKKGGLAWILHSDFLFGNFVWLACDTNVVKVDSEFFRLPNAKFDGVIFF